MSSVPSGNGGEARNKLRAIVVGGSIVGLATAAVLNNQGGWEVKVYEKSSGDLSQRGAGIFTTRPMLAYLQKLGILSEGDDIDMGRVGVPLDERWLLDREGEKIYTYAGISQISGSWSTVYSHCRASMNPENYHQGVEVESYRESEEGVEVIFKDNARRPERCDVLVGADGSSSKIRSLLIDEIARKLDPLTTENVLGRMEVDRNLQDIFQAVDSTGTVAKNARGEGSDGATTRENSGNQNFFQKNLSSQSIRTGFILFVSGRPEMKFLFYVTPWWDTKKILKPEIVYGIRSVMSNRPRNSRGQYGTPAPPPWPWIMQPFRASAARLISFSQRSSSSSISGTSRRRCAIPYLSSTCRSRQTAAV
mmetsp:Transcript_17788/g.26447  ORF Transcript_17788/g.26447 Transcript_17788/m.26447 type:complete len:364 (-) Transcript_17788:455-1546(-)